MRQRGQVLELKTTGDAGQRLWAYRYMGTSLVNVDRTYGHLAQDGHAHAVELLDSYGQEAAAVDVGGRFVDVASPSLVTSAAGNPA